MLQRKIFNVLIKTWH